MYKKSELHVQGCFSLLIRPIAVFSPLWLPSPLSIARFYILFGSDFRVDFRVGFRKISRSRSLVIGMNKRINLREKLRDWLFLL